MHGICVCKLPSFRYTEQTMIVYAVEQVDYLQTCCIEHRLNILLTLNKYGFSFRQFEEISNLERRAVFFCVRQKV